MGQKQPGGRGDSLGVSLSSHLTATPDRLNTLPPPGLVGSSDQGNVRGVPMEWAKGSSEVNDTVVTPFRTHCLRRAVTDAPNRCRG